MKQLTAYWNQGAGWCCEKCHQAVTDCGCRRAVNYHDQSVRCALSGINHWTYSRYGCSYDSWLLRLRRACQHLERPLEERRDIFQTPDVDTAERAEKLIHLMRLQAKPRKDVAEAMEVLIPKLTGKQRAVLALYLSGVQHAQIGSTLGMSEGASKMAIARVKEKASLN